MYRLTTQRTEKKWIGGNATSSSSGAGICRVNWTTIVTYAKYVAV